MTKIVWDLNKPLLKKSINRKIVVKPASDKQLIEVGKILVITWGGFIKSPDVTVKRVGPYLAAVLEQPFIAYLNNMPIGCVSPRLDTDSKTGILDGGVHVLPEHRRKHVGTTLLLVALKWLKDHDMKKAEVTPFNPEGEEAIERATVFYLANGGKRSETAEHAKPAPKQESGKSPGVTTFKSFRHSL
jgi:GNAT superfamily N-acetyltransferase